MWRSAPEVDEADAIMAEQFMMYERQIEEYQLAAPISHWDGEQGKRWFLAMQLLSDTAHLSIMQVSAV